MKELSPKDIKFLNSVERLSKVHDGLCKNEFEKFVEIKKELMQDFVLYEVVPDEEQLIDFEEKNEYYHKERYFIGCFGNAKAKANDIAFDLWQSVKFYSVKVENYDIASVKIYKRRYMFNGVDYDIQGRYSYVYDSLIDDIIPEDNICYGRYLHWYDKK